MPATCRAPQRAAAAPGPMPAARSAARPLMPARRREARDQARRARRALHRKPFDAGGVPRAGIKPGEAVPPRQDQCRGIIGREALDAGTVASGAGIKAGEALPREALDAANVLLDVPRASRPGRHRPMGCFGTGNKHSRSQSKAPRPCFPRAGECERPDLPVADLVAGRVPRNEKAPATWGGP
jgi:hypothetical protein